MAEAKEATDPETTLLGLGPPEPLEPSVIVALSKTDPKDASVVTMRAWSTTMSEYDALTSASDDDIEALRFAVRPTRRRALLALGAFAVLGALVFGFALRRPAARHSAQRDPTTRQVASSAPKVTVLVGGPWVLRSGDAAEETLDIPRRVPDYVFSPGVSSERSDRPARHVPSMTRPSRSARVISDPAEAAATGDPGRIQAVADAVELEDDEGATEAPSAAKSP